MGRLSATWNRWFREGVKANHPVPDAFSAYENGKHRRYNLLFTVNGGAFAVAKLLAEDTGRSVLGNLTLGQLAVGMILFTTVMVFDIFVFGLTMRNTFLPKAFGPPGRVVLLAIGVLICAGWALVA